MTMTNKIKDVELVWTLGAMLAKSAELTGAGWFSWLSKLNYSLVFLLLAVLALLFPVLIREFIIFM
jgi:apyrase/ectonucleoside triphosphate diphosphohydrolase 5/6